MTSEANRKEKRLEVSGDDVMVEAVYASTWAESMSEMEVSTLCATYNTRNFEKGITGVLLSPASTDVKVLGALQGPERAVRELLGVIAKDRRHAGLMILRFCTIPIRTYTAFGLKFYPPHDGVTFQALWAVATGALPYVPRTLRMGLVKGGCPAEYCPRVVRCIVVCASLPLGGAPDGYQSALTSVSDVSERMGCEEGTVVMGAHAFMMFSPRMWPEAIEAARRVAPLRTAVHTFTQIATAAMAHYTCLGPAVVTAIAVLAAVQRTMVLTKAFTDHTGRTMYKHLGFFPSGVEGLEELSLYIPTDMC